MNTEQEPEWLHGFKREYHRQKNELDQETSELRNQFFSHVRKQAKKKQYMVENQGTIKKYMTSFQLSILNLLKKHIFEKQGHPIAVLCKIFREQFGLSYNKYV